VRSEARAVARPRTGWPSFARRVMRGRPRVAARRAAGTRIRPQADDRAPDLAYGGSVPAGEPRRATASLTVERW